MAAIRRHEVNSLIAGKYYGIKRAHLSGNGAAELINSLMKTINGNIGIIFPTFDEYPSRMNKNYIVPYYPKNRNFSYNCEELMNYYDNFDIKALLLINPDNPSGNFINKAEIQRLLEWTKQKDIRLIVDESFVDFVDSSDAQTLLSEMILQENKHLAVIKSISKSFGVPGLRLGVIGSADEELISFIKKDISIWNINSIAEFYLQICGKYTKEYSLALDKFKFIRKKFIEELRKIPNLRVIPTQANFVMRSTWRIFGGEIVETLLCEHGILIKTCQVKKESTGNISELRLKLVRK